MVAPVAGITPPLRAREEAQFRYIVRTLLRPRTIAATVTAGATSLAVTFASNEPDTTYGVWAIPAWNTNIWVTSKATTGFTLNFGTAAPGGGSTVDWLVYRE